MSDKSQLSILRNNEVINILGISQSTLDRLVKAGKLKKIKLSQMAVGYKREDVQQFIDNCMEVRSDR
ncbi:helix-turn-helix transcriptional regulator [Marinicella litoralis]|uniref:AlpA family transcriptional regulator n=1 Tax=Marinicella litoralis TaxID=644220 RepID=A0A4R6XZY6_9GAMM|nr:helix-turn-helix domain-containing protein [Marinicella litoralis]TDR23897.1 AlpA family transcriptional regulator [Marinicella litoralis]